MGNLIGYLIVAVLGALLWANNWGIKVIDIWRDWPVILIVIGVWGMIKTFFEIRKGG